jgi:hypothetical protein
LAVIRPELTHSPFAAVKTTALLWYAWLSSAGISDE